MSFACQMPNAAPAGSAGLTAAQVKEIAGAAGWRLEEGEVLELERQAAKVETPLGEDKVPNPAALKRARVEDLNRPTTYQVRAAFWAGV